MPGYSNCRSLQIPERSKNADEAFRIVHAGTLYNNQNTSWNFENTLSFTKSFDKQNFTALVCYIASEAESSSPSINARGFDSAAVQTVNAGSTRTAGYSEAKGRNVAAIGTGTWTLESGPNIPVITSPNSPTSTVTGMVDGAYVFMWSITNGVCVVSFSTVTYTTLGYGDITLPPVWRVMSGFEAMNGILLFGWSTAMFYAVVQRIIAGIHQKK